MCKLKSCEIRWNHALHIWNIQLFHRPLGLAPQLMGLLLAGWSNFRPTRLSVGIVRGFSWELTMNYIWLVVLTILKNRKVNEKEYPIYKMENKKMFETTNQILNDTVVYVLWDSSIFLLWYGYIVEKWWLISSHNYGKSPYLTGNWCFIELNRPWLP